jgi:alpha-galactosidase
MKVRANGITRREILGLLVSAPLARAAYSLSHPTGSLDRSLDLRSLSRTQGRVVPYTQASDVSRVKLVRQWRNSLCRSRVTNDGTKPARVKEVVLFEIELPLPNETRLFGEAFQMLSQTGGTLGEPKDLGNYTDAKHYRMPAPPDTRVLHGMLALTAPTGDEYLFGFTSCRRFNGQFYLRNKNLQVVVDTEGLELAPGETWELEEFTFRRGSSRDVLLADLAKSIAQNHRPLKFSAPPTGWCSWYCFGPRVTAHQVLDNLDFIARNAPGLKYIQIDDGYQPAMGDWLETGAAFGGNVQGVLKEIRQRGFEPAIWVAPFIAEEKSQVFTQHPEWFVKDNEGKPLRSDRVTFGGWRHGPWYVLDGTHPEVQRHFENLFRTMRREWGCTYFKLDANFWGAIHGGTFHDRRATRIEAYRRGMQAILRGAEDGFILGCNHPIWPSLGLIHGSRSSNDVKRAWDRFKSIARQNLNRNWQNGRLWWNDPDALVLMGDLAENEFEFHATSVFASGGMLLSGDDLTTISANRLEMLRKLLPPLGVAAEFADDRLRVGRVKSANREVVCLLNWEDEPQTIAFPLSRPRDVRDFWTGEVLGRKEGTFASNLGPRSARLLVCS